MCSTRSQRRRLTSNSMTKYESHQRTWPWQSRSVTIAWCSTACTAPTTIFSRALVLPQQLLTTALRIVQPLPRAGFRAPPLACVQEARSYHDDKYWLNRARVRLDRVNWSEGASRLTMDVVRDAITDMKLERAGELKPVYVKPTMWGERRL